MQGGRELKSGIVSSCPVRQQRSLEIVRAKGGLARRIPTELSRIALLRHRCDFGLDGERAIISNPSVK
jgi:hypothetical protein